MGTITVAFDVDGTLIEQCGGKEDTPRYEIIEIFKMFESLGCHMVIWSGGGTDYAEMWARKLGLNAEIRPKEKGDHSPDITLDDMEVTLGKINLIAWRQK